MPIIVLFGSRIAVGCNCFLVCSYLGCASSFGTFQTLPDLEECGTEISLLPLMLLPHLRDQPNGASNDVLTNFVSGVPQRQSLPENDDASNWSNGDPTGIAPQNGCY
ncbi:hypothetical protein LXL04_010404 [Taraxacum kok-saghyz]